MRKGRNALECQAAGVRSLFGCTKLHHSPTSGVSRPPGTLKTSIPAHAIRGPGASRSRNGVPTVAGQHKGRRLPGIAKRHLVKGPLMRVGRPFGLELPLHSCGRHGGRRDSARAVRDSHSDPANRFLTTEWSSLKFFYPIAGAPRQLRFKPNSASHCYYSACFTILSLFRCGTTSAVARGAQGVVMCSNGGSCGQGWNEKPFRANHQEARNQAGEPRFLLSGGYCRSKHLRQRHALSMATWNFYKLCSNCYFLT